MEGADLCFQVPGNHDSGALQKILDIAADGQKGCQIPDITEQIQMVSFLGFWHVCIIPQDAASTRPGP